MNPSAGKNSRVSFLIAVYNQEKFICEAVDSCLRQTHPDVEVVVTDDGSTDDTHPALRNRFGSDERVQILAFDQNRGKVAAYNHAFRHSTGSFIAIMGGDDLSLPNRAELSLEALSRTGAGMICGDCIRFGEGAENRLAGAWFGLHAEREIGFDDQLKRPRVFGGTIFATRVLCEQIFPLNEKLGHEDWWLPLAAARRARVRYIDEPLLKYRFHAQHTSAGNPGLAFGDWLKRTQREIPYYAAVMEGFDLTPGQKRYCRMRTALLEMLGEPALFRRVAKGLKGAGAALGPGIPAMERAKYALACASPELAHRASEWWVRRRRAATL